MKGWDKYLKIFGLMFRREIEADMPRQWQIPTISSEAQHMAEMDGF